MISIKTTGSSPPMEVSLAKMSRVNARSLLDHYGRLGVDALSNNTPVDTGLAAHSWSYTIEETSTGYSLVWSNHDVEGGANVAILIQYGHATGTGGYVEGRDFINPVIQPLFDQIAQDVWKEVQNA